MSLPRKINMNNKNNWKKKDYTEIPLLLKPAGVTRERTKEPTWSDYKLNSRKSAFLELFSRTGVVKRACEHLDIHHGQVTRWCRRDPEFVEAYEEAKKIACQNMEDEAYRRGVEGYDEPVYFKGEKVGEMRKYSDSLLTTLLKGNFPEKYRERYEHQLTAGEMEFDYSRLTEEELEYLDGIFQKTLVPKG